MNALLVSFLVAAVLSLNPVEPKQDAKVITRLVGQRQTITITSTGNGPRYSVAWSDGRIVVANATLDELRIAHPESFQQIRSAIATTPAEPVITATVDLD